MTRSVLLAPHNDDESLFAAFTCYTERPKVVVCYRSARQEGKGITASARATETGFAARVLRCEYEQWSYPDAITGPTPFGLVSEIYELATMFRYCWAPAVEEGGHPNHNTVGALALAAFGPERVGRYLTYTDRGRSTSEYAVVPEPGAVAAKLRALACYTSQISEPSTAPHFVGPLTEYLAE